MSANWDGWSLGNVTQKTGCSGPELLASPLSPTGKSGRNPGGQDGLLRALPRESVITGMLGLHGVTAGFSVKSYIL